MRLIKIMQNFLAVACLLGYSSIAFTLPPGIKYLKEPRYLPDFTLPDMEGTKKKLTDYRGKVVVISFWATWCVPCIKEMPSMEQAARQLKEENIHFLAINNGESREHVENYLKQNPVQLPILLDEAMTTANNWRVIVLPTAYVLDTAGRIIFQAIGRVEWDDPKILDQIRAVKLPFLNSTKPYWFAAN